MGLIKNLLDKLFVKTREPPLLVVNMEDLKTTVEGMLNSDKYKVESFRDKKLLISAKVTKENALSEIVTSSGGSDFYHEIAEMKYDSSYSNMIIEEILDISDTTPYEITDEYLNFLKLHRKDLQKIAFKLGDVYIEKNNYKEGRF